MANEPATLAPPRYSYDPECLELARRFGVTDAAAEDLAQRIQDAVEMWFVGRNEDCALVELCKHDGKPCHVSADTEDAHWRCGTSACRAIVGAPTHD